MTPDELRAVAYFAVGVTSEGSDAGRDVSYRLGFAGNVRNGVMDPVGNSGYSFGTLQIDLGQHPDIARQMLDGYQRWAAAQPDRAALELTQTAYDSTLEALQRTGRQMRAAGAHDIDRSNINRFLASDQGKAFVHGLDTQHVNGVTAEDTLRGNGDSALERLRRTDAYRNASEEDQAQLAGMFMKLQNQAGNGHWPGIMRRVEAGTLTSPDDVKTAIDALLPNQRNGDPDYIQSGADNTLRGVAVFNALRNASPDNPLSQAWANVVANPLIGPVAAHQPNPANPDLAFQYDTVRSLFLSPEASQRFIHSLDRGGTMSEGHPQPRNGRPQAGFYVAGDDFVHWNRDGHGVAYIGGQWSEIERSQITRVDRGNGVVDLNITRNGVVTPLLHIDPREPALRPEQPQPVAPQPHPAAPGMQRPGGRPDAPEGQPGQHHAPPRQPEPPRGRRADGPDLDASDPGLGQRSAPQRHAALLLDNPAHQNHAMFATLLRTVNERDKELGREPDEISRQLAGGLVEKARERGLEMIGAARFTPDGTKVGMTDTADLSAPWAKTAVGDVGQLAGQKLSQSSDNVATINQQQALEQSLKPPTQTQGMDGPDGLAPRGPRLV
jgi:nucleoside diphosphate kinase